MVVGGAGLEETGRRPAENNGKVKTWLCRGGRVGLGWVGVLLWARRRDGPPVAQEVVLVRLARPTAVALVSGGEPRAAATVGGPSGALALEERNDAGDVVAVAAAITDCPLLLGRFNQVVRGILGCRQGGGGGVS